MFHLRFPLFQGCSLFALLFFMESTLAFSQSAPLTDQHFARGLELQKAGKLEEAIIEYELSVKQTPRFPVLANLGVIHAQMGKYAEAVQYYERALTLAPGQPMLLLNLGLAHYKMGALPRAVFYLQQVLKKNPKQKQAKTLLADCLYQQGEYKRVIEELKDWEQKDSDDMTIAYLLGNAYVLDGQMEAGQKILDRILNRGNSAEAHLMMGTIYAAVYKKDEAISELQKAIQLNPRLPVAHSNLGVQMLRSNVFDVSQAIAEFEAELQINPNDFTANFYAGYLYRRNKEYDKAMKFFDKAILLRPGDGGTLLQKALIHYLKNELDPAQRILEEVVKNDPEFIDAHVNLARVYYRKKMVAEGEREQKIADELQAKQQEPEKGASNSKVLPSELDMEKRERGNP